MKKEIDLTTVKGRLKAFCGHLGISEGDFEDSVKISNGYVSSIRKGIGDKVLPLILDKYPNLNRDWLLFGEGSMLKEEDNNESISLTYKTGSESIDIESAGKDWIVTKSGMRYYEREDGLYHLETMLVPFEAHQAYLADDVQEYGEWEKVTFIVDRIGRGRYLGWRTLGESMFNYQNPSFYDTPSKALILSRELGRHLWRDGFYKDKAERGWILVTNKNILHKDIVEFDKSTGNIICHSRNPDPEYQDFELNLNDVKEIHKVITRNGI